jgi:hypothetical protein
VAFEQIAPFWAKRFAVLSDINQFYVALQQQIRKHPHKNGHCANLSDIFTTSVLLVCKRSL